MKQFLHSPNTKTELGSIYQDAFANARELFVVSAYLTEWDHTLELNARCKTFRLIIGKDFGITRKFACLKVLRWLSSGRKQQFMVADNIQGFHPKAMFWLNSDGQAFSLIGSSNLTKAAFETNYEANAFSEISADEYVKAKAWIKDIERQSVIVSEDWIESYRESNVTSNDRPAKTKANSSNPTILLTLEEPPDTTELLKARRYQMRCYSQKKASIVELFRKCAAGKISSEQFFESLPSVWDMSLENRLQGKGWERRGKAADFKALTASFLRVLDAPDAERDDIVVSELGHLADSKNPARKAFFSEMLCLAFPKDYPVLNQPVSDYIKDMRFRAPRGATEGGRYIDLAKKLRSFLVQNPAHPAKTIAELDTIIWRVYGNGTENAA
ncbi:MAG: NgoFVII family restriction endonuclease [Desulfocapsaceae bacterium]|jgi:hypothetical protein|nr:NgoFVII family restriction endonuclease [Desulfocapsaceae bacterium]